MSLIGGTLGIALLNLASRNGAVERCDVATAYIGRSKLEMLLGPRIWDHTRDKDVLDFGCGPGGEAVEIAERGAGASSASTCASGGSTSASSTRPRASPIAAFAHEWSDPVDLIVSLDSFEHFADPAGVLEQMHRLLRRGGKVLAAFGPTWYHPLGGHIYSVFPFSHLLFSERALVQWQGPAQVRRSHHHRRERLNKMTIRRFIQLVEASPLRFVSFELLPIRPLRLIASRYDARVHDRGGALRDGTALTAGAGSAAGGRARHRARRPAPRSARRTRGNCARRRRPARAPRRGHRSSASGSRHAGATPARRWGRHRRGAPRSGTRTTGSRRSDTARARVGEQLEMLVVPRLRREAAATLGRPHRDVADAALAIGAPPADQLPANEIAEAGLRRQSRSAVGTPGQPAFEEGAAVVGQQPGERIAVRPRCRPQRAAVLHDRPREDQGPDDRPSAVDGV